MSYPPQDPQWGQQPEYGDQYGYGDQQYGDDQYGYDDQYGQQQYDDQYGYGQPPPSGGGNQRWFIIAVVAVLVLAAGGIGAFFATRGNDDTQAGPTSSVSSPASTIPSSGSGSTTTAASCRVPSGGTSVPNLAAPGLLADALSGNASFTTPTVRFTSVDSGATLNSLCFDRVSQQDLGLLLAFLDGAGYTKADGKTAQQKLYRASSSQSPKLVAVTVTGALMLDRNNFDKNTGAAEVDWET